MKRAARAALFLYNDSHGWDFWIEDARRTIFPPSPRSSITPPPPPRRPGTNFPRAMPRWRNGSPPASAISRCWRRAMPRASWVTPLMVHSGRRPATAHGRTLHLCAGRGARPRHRQSLLAALIEKARVQGLHALIGGATAITAQHCTAQEVRFHRDRPPAGDGPQIRPLADPGVPAETALTRYHVFRISAGAGMRAINLASCLALGCARRRGRRLMMLWKKTSPRFRPIWPRAGRCRRAGTGLSGAYRRHRSPASQRIGAQSRRAG